MDVNEFLSELADGRLNFRKRDLSNFRLQGQNLRGISLCGANLRGADLSHADLRRTTALRRVDEQERERLFRFHGIRVIERFDSKRCENQPELVVQEFLQMLDKMY
ncbi:pentapeptide repeat-containing protein [Anabaena azotica]|uniref:Pentapeptide repeat-containing protein n=1 Tax=Anabaena azotica FACHB-119 TaxID=947527 RepID=A0ABR8DAA5_9NOST|nr:pentapeptide repeat-containing protein [Anabaena azotica]MBD2503847.1 pentapeptide repeat-containing protein [Anabaena azotica FACHB-119]